MLTRSDYHAFRRVYQPADLKLIVVAESPPVSGLYFYNPAGAVSEPLFSAFMQQIGVKPRSKDEGLRSFHQKGWLLADSTYEPVNVDAYKKVERNRIIMRDYPLLRDDLLSLTPDRSVPLIVIKSNVCELLDPALSSDGFNVLNRGRKIFFPSNGRQTDFHRQFADVLSSHHDGEPPL